MKHNQIFPESQRFTLQSLYSLSPLLAYPQKKLPLSFGKLPLSISKEYISSTTTGEMTWRFTFFDTTFLPRWCRDKDLCFFFFLMARTVDTRDATERRKPLHHYPNWINGTTGLLVLHCTAILPAAVLATVAVP